MKSQKMNSSTNFWFCVRKISRTYVTRSSHADFCRFSMKLLFNSSIISIWTQLNFNLKVFSWSIWWRVITKKTCNVFQNWTFLWRLIITHIKLKKIDMIIDVSCFQFDNLFQMQDRFDELQLRQIFWFVHDHFDFF